MAPMNINIQTDQENSKVKLPKSKPIALGQISDEEFDALMNNAIASYSNRQCSPIDEFEASFIK